MDAAEETVLAMSAKITCDAAANEVYDACPKVIDETCKVGEDYLLMGLYFIGLPLPMLKQGNK